MLKIRKLKISVGDKKILKGVDLDVKAGEVVCVMGPNGSGKSSLAGVIARNSKFSINSGTMSFRNKDITKLSAYKVAGLGVFLAHQNPVEIDGVDLGGFLFEVHKAVCKSKGEKSKSVFEFNDLVRGYMEVLCIDASFLERSLNVGLSGGEKKKIEILQMLVLDPEFVILDEIDSGLDVDALKTIGKVVCSFLNKKKGVLIITHYQRVLKYIKPDRVVVLEDGVISRSGGVEVVKSIERGGFKI